MTCIVGLTHEDEVWMGCDSYQSVGGVELSTKWAKIRRRMVPAPGQGITTSILIGGAGSHRFVQLAHYALTIPPLRQSQMTGEGLLEYMVKDFTDAWRECLSESGHMGASEGADFTSNLLLVALCGRLFVVGCDFSIEEGTRPYRAIGAGEDAAMGALFAAEELGQGSGRERIEMALRSASEIVAGVAPPFHIEKL